MLFDAMLEEYEDLIVKKGSLEAKFVNALILGKSDICPNEKKYLFEIVNNKRNQIDVDKIDYMLRDAKYLNAPQYVQFNPEFLL